MSIYILSDTHLDETYPEITATFFNFLNDYAKQAKAIYILGDLFESWIGDDNLSPFNLSVMRQLHKASLYCPIYVMLGNRDFLLGKKFCKLSGCQLLPEEYCLDIFGVPTLLMHGDTLCTLDIAYLKFRKMARNRFMQFLFLLKPLKSRLRIAEQMRLKSKSYTQNTAATIMDVTQDAVIARMQAHQVHHLIHGHTHRPDVHNFDIDGKPAKRTVLGAWHDGGWVLWCKENGEQQVILLPTTHPES